MGAWIHGYIAANDAASIAAASRLFSAASPLQVAPLDAEREREGAATNAAENLRRERVQIRK